MTTLMEIVAGIIGFVVLFLVLRALSTGRTPKPELDGPVTEDLIREHIAQGRKIQAIKAYRRLHGTDLKDSKEAVEEMARGISPPS